MLTDLVRPFCFFVVNFDAIAPFNQLGLLLQEHVRETDINCLLLKKREVKIIQNTKFSQNRRI